MKKGWLITNSGFSMVEAILSVSLFVIVVAAFSGAIFYGQEGIVLSGVRSQALLVAEEGLAVVRNIRNNDFLNLNDGIYGLALSGGQWQFSGSSDVNGNFTRAIEIQTIDQSTKRIISRVNWQYGAKSGEISLDSYLTDWRGTSGEFKMESGLISTDENWLAINFINTYISPVVVATRYSAVNSRSASVRIRNMTETGCEIRLQEPRNRNLSAEEIAYWVVEEGSWDMEGVKIEAGKYDTNTVGRKNNWLYDTQTFNQSFAGNLIVLHQVMSFNDSRWITTYVSNLNSRTDPPDAQGMRIALNGAEAYTTHNIETIGWVAVDAGSTTTIATNIFESYQTSNTVRGKDNGCFTFGYQNSYSNPPLALASQQEMDDNDGSWGVICSNSAIQIGLQAEEDQYTDTERSHGGETFGFVAFAAPALYPACECSNWTNNQCGGNGCSATQLYQTRTCSIAGCDIEEQCVDDSCTAWVDQGCGLGGCGSDYMAQARTCAFGCDSQTQCVLDTCGAWGRWYCLDIRTRARDRTCVYGCLSEREIQTCARWCIGNRCR